MRRGSVPKLVIEVYGAIAAAPGEGLKSAINSFFMILIRRGKHRFQREVYLLISTRKLVKVF
jgi:hypothetical protein